MAAKRRPRKKKRAPIQLEKKTLAQLRKKLWLVMSKALRARWKNEDGTTECYTCRTQIPEGGKVDCGHGWPKRKYPGVYYDERNLRAQCVSCNMAGQGEQWAFFHRLIEEIGQAEFDLMSEWRYTDRPTRKEWYIREIRRWQSLS
jgi:hypothetical protein